jgi:hypothetical protein
MQMNKFVRPDAIPNRAVDIWEKNFKSENLTWLTMLPKLTVLLRIVLEPMQFLDFVACTVPYILQAPR